MFEYFSHFAIATIPRETGQSILTAIGLTNSIFTFVLANVMQRPSMVRWRRFCWLTLLALWLAIIPCILDTVHAISVWGFNSAGTKLAILLWAVGLAGLMILVYRIFTISLPAFTKDFSVRDVFGYREIQKFEYSANHSFGVPFMDAFIQSLKDSGGHLYYPILLISEFNAPGLEIAQDFLAEGLRKGEGAVYLSFTRPWDIIVKQIAKRVDRSDPSSWERGFTIIDCYSKLYLRKRMRVFPEVRKSLTVRFCDPRDTLQVNKTYKDCLSTTQKRGFHEARALYDSLSDFLAISDPELVVSYLRHSIVWEELRCVKAMYLLWPEVLSEPINDTYLSWFINTIMKIKVAETGYSASVEGVLPSPRRFDLTRGLEIATGKEHGQNKALKG